MGKPDGKLPDFQPFTFGKNIPIFVNSMETDGESAWAREDLLRAIEVLKQGGVILYPTDTIWGIGCDATNNEAVERVYRIKERPAGKSMLVLVSDIKMAEQYTFDTPPLIWEIMLSALDPLTLIFPHARNFAENLPAADGSIGIRLTQDPFCAELIRLFGKPIVSSSANPSSFMPPRHFLDISQELIDAVDYVVEWRQDDMQDGRPSTVVKLRDDGEMEMLRP
jgi:L-threonylcarbamoyladenylate synthase